MNKFIRCPYKNSDADDEDDDEDVRFYFFLHFILLSLFPFATTSTRITIGQ